MLTNYSDITSKLGEPFWYDAKGVPRYEPFTPHMCSIYLHACALIEIKCQVCPKTFKVAIEFDMMHGWAGFPKRETFTSDEAYQNRLGNMLHYGDPPRHCFGETLNDDECHSGDTMNSVPLKIIEAWDRIGIPLPEWMRIVELNETVITPDWADEEIAL